YARPLATTACGSGLLALPGATAFTRIPSGPHSVASERTRPSIPAFEAQYDARAPNPWTAQIEDSITTLDPSCRCGRAVFAPTNAPRRFTPSTRSHSSTG